MQTETNIHDEIPRPERVYKGLLNDCRAVQERGMITKIEATAMAKECKACCHYANVSTEPGPHLFQFTPVTLQAFAQFAYAKGLEDMRERCADECTRMMKAADGGPWEVPAYDNIHDAAKAILALIAHTESQDARIEALEAELGKAHEAMMLNGRQRIQMEAEIGRLEAECARVKALVPDEAWLQAASDKVEEALNAARMSEWKDEDEEPLPLVDLLTYEGQTIDMGRREIEHLAEVVYFALKDFLATPATATPDGRGSHSNAKYRSQGIGA